MVAQAKKAILCIDKQALSGRSEELLSLLRVQLFSFSESRNSLGLAFIKAKAVDKMKLTSKASQTGYKVMSGEAWKLKRLEALEHIENKGGKNRGCSL